MIIIKIKPFILYERALDKSSSLEVKSSPLNELRSDVNNKKLWEIRSLFPSFIVSSDGTLKGKNTWKVYEKIDIASFRQLPINSTFVHTQISWENEKWYSRYHTAIMEKNKDGHSIYKEWKNIYFSDKNGSYVYLGNSNIINHFEWSNTQLEKMRVPEEIKARYQYHDDSSIDYFISNGNLYAWFGQKIYIFPDEKKWDKSFKIHGDFSLVETSDGSLYSKKDSGNWLEKLPFKLSEVVIQKKSWETLEDPKNWVNVSIKIKKTWKIITFNPYFPES